MSYIKLIKIMLISVCLLGCPWQSKPDTRQTAANLAQEKKYEDAINAYLKHIEARLAVKDRPEWENPYIYYLDIGDLYLEQSLVEKAINKYLAAEKQAIKKAWVSDRLRQVANWYEEKGLLKEAIEHLKKYSDYDELLFNLMLNRMAQKLVAQEEQAAKP